MISSQQRYRGSGYHAPIAFLILALVFTAVVLLGSRPIGHVTAGLALAFSAVCMALAWAYWGKYSTLAIPSIVSRDILDEGKIRP